MLSWIWLALRVGGFRWTLRWARRDTDLVLDTPLADIESARRVARSVAAAAAILPGRLRCLEQSLALYALLQRHGIPSHLRIGVQPHGMTAHAWVECHAEPVNEFGELLRKLVAFPEIAV